MPAGPIVRGEQRPRVLSVPAEVETSPAGEDAIELAASAGLHLDPWQRFVLHQSLAEQLDPVSMALRWQSFEVGLVVSRQNGKGSIIEARELAGLFLFDEALILHSAHQFDTALEAFQRILTLIESTPDLDKLVKRVSRAHGEEGIETLTGNRLRFKARTARGGRGFSGDVVILDEAMYLPAAVMSALMPTMAARPNPQLWYTASAVDETEHPDGGTLAAIRNRALAGGDRSLFYAEWSADPGQPTRPGLPNRPEDVPVTEQRIAQANPALGYRLTRTHIGNEQRSMLRRSFAVERLGIGAWPVETDGEGVLDKVKWAAARDPHSTPLDPVAVAVDVTPDRSRASIGVAAWRPDGRKHVQCVRNREGTHWVIPSLLKLIKRWDPVVLVLDPSGPAGSLLAGLAAKGVEPETTTAQQMAAACGAFYDDVQQDGLRHLGDEDLAEAVGAVKKRSLSGGFAWTRSDATNISPLVAVTLAAWGLVAHGNRPSEALSPVGAPAGLVVPDTRSTPLPRAAHSDDLSAVGF